MHDSHRYGCHNRKLGTYTVVQNGWFMDGVTRAPKMEAIPFRSSRECVYSTSDLGRADPSCRGCSWNQSERGRDEHSVDGGVATAG